MTQLIAVLALVASSAVAFADIPLPHPHPRPTFQPALIQTRVDGEAAVALFALMDGGATYRESLWTTNTVIRVVRSNDGEAQAVCSQTTSWRAQPNRVTTTCTLTRSTNGAPVPEYRHIPRVG
jgi:hypothetical protein